MRINQVEELVGITKKNIRFYEDQGLLNPARNPENGYREYNLDDVAVLQRIKLLRKLSVPIEEIRLLQEKKIHFTECMERHMITLKHQQYDLELMREMCKNMKDEVQTLDGLDASGYLEQMQQLEKQGTRFMNIEKKDVRKKKIGPILAGLISVIVVGTAIGLIVWGNMQSPVPLVAFIAMVIPFGVIILGIIAALIQRLREIDGGEEDEARNY